MSSRQQCGIRNRLGHPPALDGYPFSVEHSRKRGTKYGLIRNRGRGKPQAPTARHIIAQGNALGLKAKTPEGQWSDTPPIHRTFGENYTQPRAQQTTSLLIVL